MVVSTTGIVIFGEIIPQALCARYGLRIGACAAPFVLGLVRQPWMAHFHFPADPCSSQMYIEFPIAYPIAKLLDYLLGESHGTLYKKAELKTFVGLHRRTLALCSPFQLAADPSRRSQKLAARL